LIPCLTPENLHYRLHQQNSPQEQRRTTHVLCGKPPRGNHSQGGFPEGTRGNGSAYQQAEGHAKERQDGTGQKQALLEEISKQEKDAEKQQAEEAKLQEIKQWLEENPAGLQEYDDQLTRQYIERITVVDKSHIRVKFLNVEEITQEVR
jgi:hypothetical protein